MRDFKAYFEIYIIVYINEISSSSNYGNMKQITFKIDEYCTSKLFIDINIHIFIFLLNINHYNMIIL